MKHFTITHLIYASGATALTRASLNYYIATTENPVTLLLVYVVVIPPLVVFFINKKNLLSGRKAHAQTALISVVLTLFLGIIQNLI
ncbi:MAG: hypothetical protein Salg2KO_06530 [Salibacteraceae bacterium]